MAALLSITWMFSVFAVALFSYRYLRAYKKSWATMKNLKWSEELRYDGPGSEVSITEDKFELANEKPLYSPKSAKLLWDAIETALGIFWFALALGGAAGIAYLGK
jgi:hypothetical protein